MVLKSTRNQRADVARPCRARRPGMRLSRYARSGPLLMDSRVQVGQDVAGATSITRMPLLAHSTARQRVIAPTAALQAQ